MPVLYKGKSPFYPGQPVPVELFVGRSEQIDHIMRRGVGQVEHGKPVAMYIEGEYGIGKSSIAGYVQSLAERQHGLHSIYVALGPAESLDDMGAAVLEATVRSGAFDTTRSERVRSWLAKYIGEQSLFGLTLHADALRKDGPTIANGMLPFLTEALQRLSETGVRGILLTFDEINGITANPKFAHFLKGLVDANAMASTPLPLFMLLCGVEKRRREMIHAHRPVERIFDVVRIERMSAEEMAAFFEKAFGSVQTRVEPDALDLMTHYSAGFPKIMHIVGDAAFWLDRDDVIDPDDAYNALISAADEVGRKYVDQQVFSALRSRDYHSILAKIARPGPSMTFQRAKIAEGLTPAERKKLDNFLQRMKKLNVIRSGQARGEYTFNVRMVHLYIWLESVRRHRKHV